MKANVEDSIDRTAFALKLKKYIRFERQRITINGSRQYRYRGIRFKTSETQNSGLFPD